MILFSETLFLLWWDKLQNVPDTAFKNRAETCQNINVQARDFVIAIVVELGALHLRALTQLVFADTAFLDQLRHMEPDFPEFFHKNTTPLKIIDRDSVSLVDFVYKLQDVLCSFLHIILLVFLRPVSH